MKKTLTALTLFLMTSQVNAGMRQYQAELEQSQHHRMAWSGGRERTRKPLLSKGDRQAVAAVQVKTRLVSSLFSEE